MELTAATRRSGSRILADFQPEKPDFLLTSFEIIIRIGCADLHVENFQSPPPDIFVLRSISLLIQNPAYTKMLRWSLGCETAIFLGCPVLE